MGKCHSSEHMMKTLPRRMTLCPALLKKKGNKGKHFRNTGKNGHSTVRISAKVNSRMFLAGCVGVSADHISIDLEYG